MTVESVCYFNKFGFCKFLQKCRFRHVDKLCDDENCEIKSCSSRHPKACRYFSEFKMCKFGEYCRFSHIVSADDSKIEMENVVDKLDTIEKVLKEPERHMENHEANSSSMYDTIQNLTLELKVKNDVFCRTWQGRFWR